MNNPIFDDLRHDIRDQVSTDVDALLLQIIMLLEEMDTRLAVVERGAK